MTKPIKLTKDRQGEPFYPATTTDAVVDQKRVKTLSEILDDIDEAITNSGDSKKILYLELEKLEEFGEWSEEVDGVLNHRNICQIPVDIFKQEFGVNPEDFHQYTHVCDGYYGVTVPLRYLEEGGLFAIALHYGSSDTYNTMQFTLSYDDEFITITYDEYCVKSALYFIRERSQAYLKSSAESGTVASVLVPKVGNQGGEMITKLFVKHDSGWEQYSELVDGSVTMDKLSDDVQDTIEELKTKKTIISDTLTAIEFITQSAYDTKKALGELSDTTAYLITE